MYRIMLWALALVFLVLLFSCAAGSTDGRADSTRSDASAVPSGMNTAGKAGAGKRFTLLLAGTEARDSAAVVDDFYVDQALRAVLDSVPQAHYLTLNYRDSLASLSIAQGKQGIALDELASQLGLDGVVYARVGRFGSMLAVDLRVIEPATQAVLFHDLAFSVIRYRDSSGTMYLGPTLYDAVRKSIGRFFGVEHRAEAPIATVPLVVSGIVIPKDRALGRVSTLRQQLSHEGVQALSKYAQMHFPELDAFDYDSRDRLYRVVNVAAVEDYTPMSVLERRALFNVGIERYVTAITSLGSDDSIRVRLEMRMVTSATADSLVDHQELGFAKAQFETSTADEDFIVALIDLAEPLYKREAERVRERYNAAVAARK